MKELDQTKHQLDDILQRQKANCEVKKLLLEFHMDLIAKLNMRNKYPISRTNIIGISYLCNSRKAFLFLNVGQNYLTANFFTGDKSIMGINKGTWLNRKDNRGSEPYKIKDTTSLKKALEFSSEAFDIAIEWSR